MLPEYFEFHQSFVRELVSADSDELEVLLDNFLRFSSADSAPSVIRYWAWVAGELLRRGFLSQAEKVLEVACEASLKLAIDEVSRELVFCDLRTQLLCHLSRPSDLPEKNSSYLLGEFQAIPMPDEAHLLSVLTLLKLSLVYEKTGDLERAFNLLERACAMACRCEALPERLESWIGKKKTALRARLSLV